MPNSNRTQVAAWASMKSFRAKDGSNEPPSGGRNGERDFHDEARSNDTHASTTDPEARLYRKVPGSRRLTLGADKAYDVHGFVNDLRDLNVTPHIAQNTTNRTSAIDARTTRHPDGWVLDHKRRY
jgi:hypothetical protein